MISDNKNSPQYTKRSWVCSSLRGGTVLPPFCLSTRKWSCFLSLARYYAQTFSWAVSCSQTSFSAMTQSKKYDPASLLELSPIILVCKLQTQGKDKAKLESEENRNLDWFSQEVHMCLATRSQKRHWISKRVGDPTCYKECTAPTHPRAVSHLHPNRPLIWWSVWEWTLPPGLRGLLRGFILSLPGEWLGLISKLQDTFF